MTTISKPIRIGNEEHVVTADDILAVARREAPRRINAYYVEIEGRRFPPKQLLRGAIRTERLFDTGLAVRALRSLGFEVLQAGS
jgi:hypothetical protein